MSTIVIIGASSGIGLELTKKLIAAGHHVYGTYRRANEPPAGVEGWNQIDVLESNLDFSFLPKQIDGLVYCPGAVNLKPFARTKPEDFVSDYQLQVVGAVKVVQACLPAMKEVANASIVLFSTIAVQVGFPFHSLVSASKGAIEGLTRAWAAELAPRIRVNCIAPSITDTPLAGNLLNTPEKKDGHAQRHPLKKIGEPADLANAAEFLLSPQSNWMTGQILHVDGGLSNLRVG